MVLLREEVNISGGDYANKLAAHFSCLCNGNSRETVPYFGLKHIPNSVTWAHYDWVCDKALFEPLKKKKPTKP